MDQRTDYLCIPGSQDPVGFIIWARTLTHARSGNKLQHNMRHHDTAVLRAHSTRMNPPPPTLRIAPRRIPGCAGAYSWGLTFAALPPATNAVVSVPLLLG